MILIDSPLGSGKTQKLKKLLEKTESGEKICTRLLRITPRNNVSPFFVDEFGAVMSLHQDVDFTTGKWAISMDRAMIF